MGGGAAQRGWCKWTPAEEEKESGEVRRLRGSLICDGEET